jgi:hypothetical protein
MANYNYMTGKAHWVKILGDPVPNYGRDGFEWTFDFVPDEQGMDLVKELKITDKLKDKSDERGKFLAFKQKATRANGKSNDPITVVDARNRPWDPDVKIGNGSTVEVKFNVVDYGKGKPTGVYVQAVRVLEHVPYVRQEFAPLPEDSPFLEGVADDVEEIAEDVMPQGDPLEG